MKFSKPSGSRFFVSLQSHRHFLRRQALSKNGYLFFVTSRLPLWAQGSPLLALGVRQRLLAPNSRVEMDSICAVLKWSYHTIVTKDVVTGLFLVPSRRLCRLDVILAS